MIDVTLNGMRELSFKEIEDVSGGWAKPIAFAFSIFNYWRRTDDVGQGSDNPANDGFFNNDSFFNDDSFINDYAYAFA